MNLKKLKNNKKGFTLIEIIVVVVILAVLMAVAVPAVMSYLGEADKAKYETQGRAVYTAVQTEFAKQYIKDRTIGADNTTVIGNAESRLAKDDVTADVTKYTVTTNGKNVDTVTCEITIDGEKATVTIKSNDAIEVGEITKA